MNTPHPRETADVIGHDDIMATVVKHLGAGSDHHAWLFTGPKGVGKSTFAYKMIAHLLSPEEQGSNASSLFGDPEPQQQSARFKVNDQISRLISAGSHPDLKILEYDPATAERKDIGVDDVRDAVQFLRLTSSEGGKRVLLIDAADDMNRNAANALLKILEEPPSAATIIMISHQPGLLLPTIKSRCRQLAFRPIPDKDLLKILRRKCPQMEDRDIQFAAIASRGSIGEAMTWLSHDVTVLMEDLSDIMGDDTPIHWDRAMAFAGKLSSKTEVGRYDHFCRLLPWLLHQAVLIKTGQITDLDHQPQLAQQFARTFSIEGCLKAWEKVRTTLDRASQANLDKKQSVLQAFGVLSA